MFQYCYILDEEKKKDYMITQFCGIDMKVIVGHLNERLTQLTILKLFSVIDEVHQKYVVHMDIKPDNLLIKRGELFLIDFGHSCRFGELVSSPTTHNFMDPLFEENIEKGIPQKAVFELDFASIIRTVLDLTTKKAFLDGRWQRRIQRFSIPAQQFFHDIINTRPPCDDGAVPLWSKEKMLSYEFLSTPYNEKEFRELLDDALFISLKQKYQNAQTKGVVKGSIFASYLDVFADIKKETVKRSTEDDQSHKSNKRLHTDPDIF